MLSHNQVKLLTALQVKKYRQKYRKFVVEGDKMVGELLQQSRLTVEAVYGLPEWAEKHGAALEKTAAAFHPVSEQDLKRVSSLSTPNQVLALVHLPETAVEPPTLPRRFCFFLDGVQDPGNLGAILRVADWFGHPALFCSPDTADAYNPKVIQAGMGAFLRVPVREIELTDLQEELPDWPLLGADLEGENLFKAGLPDHGLIVIGREGAGIRPDTAARLTHRLMIPRGEGGGAESLNAAVAAGIVAAALANSR